LVGKIIRKATDYEQIHDTIIPLHQANGEIAREIVQVAQQYYQIDNEEIERFITIHEFNKKWEEQERVLEALQHINRDWALEGTHERANVMETILKTIDQVFPDREMRKEGPIKILLPGSGLGRLAHEIANLPNVDVTANELSWYMRMTYRYLESLTMANSRSFHPFLDWWSHQPNRAELIRNVKFPDVGINASKLLLIEGDFNEMFVNDTSHFDSIFTFFFMDTAPNMMNYFDTIANVLKPGGIWINMGPLLYHNAKVEFSLDDMMAVAEDYGFEFMDVDEEWGPLTLKNRKSRQRMVSYLVHDGSMRINAYKLQFFMARYNPKTKEKELEKDEL
jgi:SAM-dependent methyltransferase